MQGIEDKLYIRMWQSVVCLSAVAISRIRDSLLIAWRAVTFIAGFPVPNYTRPGFYSQALFILVAYCWWRWWLVVPGLAIGFLGVAAAIMAARASYLTRAEGVLWIVIAFTLFVLEVRAITNDRHQHDAEQAAQKAQFEKVLQQQQTQFDKTLAEMRGLGEVGKHALESSVTALHQITGGGQFCYLMALPAGSANGRTVFGLAVMNSGPLPLDVCRVLIHDNSPIKSAADAERNFQVIVDRELGPLPPGTTQGQKGTQGFVTDIIVPEGSYYIQINTRNDRFYETLTIHPNVPGKGLESIEVRDQQWKIVHSEP
jgi:hypothetical protein